MSLGTHNDFRGKFIQVLDNDDGPDKGWYSYLNIIVIFISILTLVAEFRFQDTYQQYFDFYSKLELYALIFFSIDFSARIICYERRGKYLLSLYGLIDFLTVAIGLLSVIFPVLSGSSALRVFRVFRFARLLKLNRSNTVFSGVTGLALPYVIAAMAFNTAVLAIEKLPWFPNVSGISIIVSVIGFILVILLGTKLNIANVRLHSVEDAVARIVGALKIFDKSETIQSDIWTWSDHFERAHYDFADRQSASKNMRVRTDTLLARLADEGITGPNVAGFSRDVSYVLHRSNANLSKTYENSLRYVIFSYTVVVILLVPSFIGIVASGLITYVLVGIYFLIDDMDAAFRSELKESFFIADITPITFYNSQRNFVTAPQTPHFPETV